MVIWAAALQAQPEKPFIIKIEPKSGDPTGLSDVLIGALGLSGALFLIAVIAAVIFGGILFWLRRRKPFDHFS
jgi:hypothetical protein